MICKWCGAADADSFIAREMMFGFRDRFEYLECKACNSVQIASPPNNLAKYYPQDFYYSFSFNTEKTKGLKRYLIAKRNLHVLGQRNPVGAILNIFKKRIDLAALGQAGVHQDDRILDVGCGNGDLLQELSIAGFSHLKGTDPFLENEIRDDRFTIYRLPISKMEGAFDVIMFNHSLEHVPSPVEDLFHARRLLLAGGTCIIRIPTTSSDAWDTYKENWVQLDAPRHLSIPSRSGLKLVADKAKFQVKNIIDDSSGFQFWGSEQYILDIPLRQAEGPNFTSKQIRQFEALAKQKNERARGDQIAVIMTAI